MHTCLQAVEAGLSSSASAESAPASGEPAAAPAEGEKSGKEEPEEMKPGDRDELWAHKWAFGPLDTIQSEAFYRMIGRTGITYGEDFRMVKRVSCRGGDAMMR